MEVSDDHTREGEMGEEMGTGWFFAYDKASLGIFWLRDESLDESDSLPDPDVIAQEIVENLGAALEQFREIAADLGLEEIESEKRR